MSKAKLKCIDLFCGAGGLSLGLKQAGFYPELALDLDPAAGATYRTNFPDVKLLTEDIRKVDWRPFTGKIDLIAGGPPCQPFSVAGDQKASEDTRDMLPEFVRAVREIRPKAFLLENVAGLASKRHSEYFLKRIQQLEELGFNVVYKVLNAAEYGVGQDRRRVIALGMRDRIPALPVPSHGPESKKAFRSAAEVLRNTPEDEPNRAIVTYAKQPVLRPSPFAGMLVNGGGRPIDLSKPANTVPASAGGNRTQIIDTSGVLVDYHAHLLEGGRPKTGLVRHVRRLTIRESARLQDFPDTFKFMGERSAQYRQIGNAVPYGLSRAVAKLVYQNIG